MVHALEGVVERRAVAWPRVACAHLIRRCPARGPLHDEQWTRATAVLGGLGTHPRLRQTDARQGARDEAAAVVNGEVRRTARPLLKRARASRHHRGRVRARPGGRWGRRRGGRRRRRRRLRGGHRGRRRGRRRGGRGRRGRGAIRFHRRGFPLHATPTRQPWREQARHQHDQAQPPGGKHAFPGATRRPGGTDSFRGPHGSRRCAAMCQPRRPGRCATCATRPMNPAAMTPPTAGPCGRAVDRPFP
jgi:hypothetical protein